ncbi:MAG: N-formylglutamate amidohydrolase [Pseudomonadota bacterium]
MPVDVLQGYSPLIISLPYTGTNMRPEISARMTAPEDMITIPDRYFDRLWTHVHDTATVMRANFHRYLSDLDAPAGTGDIKPNKGMLGCVPLINQRGELIWNVPPKPAEVHSWRSFYHAPYHAALAAQVARVRARNGHAVLLTCSALRDDAPDQTDIQMSSYMGSSCAVELSTSLASIFRNSAEYETTLSGRSGAGWTTRSYGRPAAAIHAIDLRIRESLYLTPDGEFAAHYDQSKAEKLRRLLKDVLSFAATWQPERAAWARTRAVS